MKAIKATSLYRIARWILRTALGFYFSRIERFHLERVPMYGPVLFASNPPNSITDAFVIGTSVSRKVNFVATVQLFRFTLALLPDKPKLIWNGVLNLILLVVLAPVAAYGWLHRILPITFVNYAIRRYAKLSVNKAHVSTTAILAGVIGFGLFYGACTLGIHLCFGWPVSLWYGLSLPVASLVAHYYLRNLHELRAEVRAAGILLRAPAVAQRMLVLRQQLIDEIGAARWEVPATALVPETKEPQ